MATHTRYMVTAQGNRNLALDYSPWKWCNTLPEADALAISQASEDGTTYYVHEVIVIPLRRHVPRTEVISTDV